MNLPVDRHSHGLRRLAEVGAVDGQVPVARCTTDALSSDQRGPDPSASPAPRARNKWLTASVVDDAPTAIAAIFDQAERRDPSHTRAWEALVGRNNHQIDGIAIATEAEHRNVDVIHVMEYLRGAALRFFPETDTCATYALVNKSPYPDYPRALAAGWPTGCVAIGLPCSNRWPAWHR